jgi:hypothetical protein
MLDKLKKFREVLVLLSELLRVLVPAFEVPGWGSDKKKAIQNIVSYVLDLIEEYFFALPIEKQKIIDVAGWLIEMYVAFFNKVGEFVRSVSAKASEVGTKRES